jgi:hypothetical protein
MSVIDPPSVVAGQNNTGTGEREIEAISYQPSLLQNSSVGEGVDGNINGVMSS